MPVLKGCLLAILAHQVFEVEPLFAVLGSDGLGRGIMGQVVHNGREISLNVVSLRVSNHVLRQVGCKVSLSRLVRQVSRANQLLFVLVHDF